MELQNLNNLFSIFGSFLVFDDDVMPRINNIYSDCNISINQEPNNPTNKLVAINFTLFFNFFSKVSSL